MEEITQKKSRSKRLTIEVDNEFHIAVKTRAANKQITLRTWIIRALMDQIKKETQYEQ